MAFYLEVCIGCFYYIYKGIVFCMQKQLTALLDGDAKATAVVDYKFIRISIRSHSIY